MVSVHSKGTRKESTMLIRCGLLLLCLNCVRTTEYFGSAGGRVSEFNSFSLWPSVHNAARLLRVRKEVEDGAVRHSEGGPDVTSLAGKTPSSGAVNPAPLSDVKNVSKEGKVDPASPPAPSPAAGRIAQLILVITPFNPLFSCRYVNLSSCMKCCIFFIGYLIDLPTY